MNANTFLSDRELRRFVKKVKAGETLFLQGQRANSMLLILEGRIHLIGEKNDERHLVSLIEAGQFLGEKALLSEAPYQRAYTAQAETDTVYLEFASHDLEMLQRTSPDVIIPLFKGILSGVAARFDKANYLIRALRSTNNVERIIHCLIFFCRSSGRKILGGTEIVVNAEALLYYIDIDPVDLDAVVRELEDQKLLFRQKYADHFVVPNEQALIAFLPTLLKKAA